MVEKAVLSDKYQPYPEYKNSGVEWLGFKLPLNWNTIPLKLIISTRKGVAFKSSDFCDKGIPVVKSSDIKKLSINSSNIYLPNKYIDIYPKSILNLGDIILSTVGSNPDVINSAVGQMGMLPYRLNGALLNQNTVIFDPNEIIIKRSYLFYVLQTKEYRDHLDLHAHGTANQSSLSISDMLKFHTPLPLIFEQQKIASFLDHETAKIDTLIEKQQQLIKLLKEKHQAVISHAVTKGLNPKAPMHDSGVEWLGEVPEHWEVTRLKHLISHLESGVSVNAADIPAQSDELGVLKTSCVYTRSFRVEENKTVIREEYDRVKCPIKEGSIIISRMNTPELVGASALVEITNNNIFLPDRLWQTVFKDCKKQNPKFVAFFMMIKGFRNQISLAAEGASSSMQNIAKGDYLSIHITFPRVSEQNKIIKYLEQKIDSLNRLIAQANKAITLLQERRTALISAAVTGKIDLRNWQAPKSKHPEKEQAV